MSLTLQAPRPDFGLQYAARFQPQPQPQAADCSMPLSSEQAEALFTAGLDAAAIKAMASISPETRQRGTQLAQELCQILQMLPHQPSRLLP